MFVLKLIFFISTYNFRPIILRISYINSNNNTTSNNNQSIKNITTIITCSKNTNNTTVTKIQIKMNYCVYITPYFSPVLCIARHFEPRLRWPIRGSYRNFLLQSPISLKGISRNHRNTSTRRQHYRTIGARMKRYDKAAQIRICQNPVIYYRWP